MSSINYNFSEAPIVRETEGALKMMLCTQELEDLVTLMSRQ